MFSSCVLIKANYICSNKSYACAVRFLNLRSTSNQTYLVNSVCFTHTCSTNGCKRLINPSPTHLIAKRRHLTTKIKMSRNTIFDRITWSVSQLHKKYLKIFLDTQANGTLFAVKDHVSSTKHTYTKVKLFSGIRPTKAIRYTR